MNRSINLSEEMIHTLLECAQVAANVYMADAKRFRALASECKRPTTAEKCAGQLRLAAQFDRQAADALDAENMLTEML